MLTSISRDSSSGLVFLPLSWDLLKIRLYQNVNEQINNLCWPQARACPENGHSGIYIDVILFHKYVLKPPTFYRVASCRTCGHVIQRQARL
jgi:hypothetical protein